VVHVHRRRGEKHESPCRNGDAVALSGFERAGPDGQRQQRRRDIGPSEGCPVRLRFHRGRRLEHSGSRRRLSRAYRMRPERLESEEGEDAQLEDAGTA
jgi:hypothetical protein